MLVQSMAVYVDDHGFGSMDIGPSLFYREWQGKKSVMHLLGIWPALLLWLEAWCGHKTIAHDHLLDIRDSSGRSW